MDSMSKGTQDIRQSRGKILGGICGEQQTVQQGKRMGWGEREKRKRGGKTTGKSRRYI